MKVLPIYFCFLLIMFFCGCKKSESNLSPKDQELTTLVGTRWKLEALDDTNTGYKNTDSLGISIEFYFKNEMDLEMKESGVSDAVNGIVKYRFDKLNAIFPQNKEDFLIIPDPIDKDEFIYSILQKKESTLEIYQVYFFEYNSKEYTETTQKLKFKRVI